MIKEGEWNHNRFSKLNDDLLSKLKIKSFGNDSKYIKDMHKNIGCDDGKRLFDLIEEMHQCIHNDSVLIKLVEDMQDIKLVELLKEHVSKIL